MGTSHWITRISAAAALAAFLAGCASAQRDVSQAAALGDAGIALAETLPGFYDAFFVQAVEADSLELAQQRDAERDSEVLNTALEKSNADFGTTIEIIADLNRHASLLKSYFIAFKALSAADTGGEIPGAAKQAVEQLSAVGSQIAGQKIPGSEVAAILEPIAAYAVTVAKGAALSTEFEARGALINREMALQEQVVGIVAQRMIADRKRVLIETTENPLDRGVHNELRPAAAGRLVAAARRLSQAGDRDSGGHAHGGGGS